MPEINAVLKRAFIYLGSQYSVQFSGAKLLVVKLMPGTAD